MGLAKRLGREGRVLVFNCHEGWVHQLSALGVPLDIVDGLPGRATRAWDERMRPFPKNARRLTLAQAIAGKGEYRCIVAHNLSDLMDAKKLPGPRILVIHTTLEYRLSQEHLGDLPPGYLDALDQYLAWSGAHVVAVSDRKGASWGLEAPFDVVGFLADPADYLPARGDVAAGLRVSNQFHQRRDALLVDLHERAFADVPVKIVGNNPGVPDSEPSRSWDHLKELFASHRFYVHTAASALEDGHNMSTAEAMAAGLPVLGNRHPASPIEDGVSGFLSDDPAELAGAARLLLAEPERAHAMGQAARARAEVRFGKSRFVRDFGQALERASARWRSRRAAVVSLMA